MASIVKEYAEALYLYYDPLENSFVDDDGFHIDNILAILTPLDLLLFKTDYDYNIFPHRGIKNAICIIEAKDEYYEL